jgi:hypothetical protein
VSSNLGFKRPLTLRCSQVPKSPKLSTTNQSISPGKEATAVGPGGCWAEPDGSRQRMCLLFAKYAQRTKLKGLCEREGVCCRYQVPVAHGI